MKYLTDTIGIQQENIHLISNGIDHNELGDSINLANSQSPPFKKHATNTDIIAVGRIVPIKGHNILIKALDASELESTTLRIAGDIGPSKQDKEYYSQIQELATQSRHNILLVGSLEKKEVIRYLVHSDLYVQSSLSEGWSLALSEAMACKLFTIFTDCSGIPSTLATHETTLKCTPEPGHQLKLTDSINYYCQLPSQQKEEYAELLRLFSIDQLNINNSVERFCDVVNNITVIIRPLKSSDSTIE